MMNHRYLHSHATAAITTAIINGFLTSSLLISLAGSASAQAKRGLVNWTRDCPPTGYLSAAKKAAVQGGAVNPTTALDFDLNGDGKKTAWDVPITLADKAGNVATTDENAPNPGTIFLVGIPDPAGLGFGTDHFSPRFRRKDDMDKAGVEVGQCVYTNGRNSWVMEYADANTNKVADAFTKSIWRSRNGDTTGDTAGEMTYFVTDLTKDKLTVVKTKRTAAEGNLFQGFSITDMNIADAGADLPSVPLPGPSPADADVAQTIDTMGPLEENRLIDPLIIPIPGMDFIVNGIVTNTDQTSHTISFTFSSVNATLLNTPGSFLLAPGQSMNYQIQARALNSGPLAIASMAFTENAPEGDGSLDSVVLVAASPEPGSLTFLGIGLAGMTGIVIRKHRKCRQA